MAEATGFVRARREFGDGPLSRVAALVYTVLVVELALLVTTAPGLVVLTLLERDASNLPIVAACAIPVGPALAAGLYALRHRRLDLTDLRPAATFWRGYKLNFWGVLRIWVPWLGWLTIVATSLANFGVAGVPLWWAVLLAVIAVAATLWATNALVITALFAFRTTDTARLAGLFLVRTPKVALANGCLLVVAVGVTMVGTEAGLALLAAVLTFALLHNCRPMIAQIEQEFTA